ncbi:HAD family hydrolase [Faecalitalea cylindroides]|uniref:HAD family hydrolase n=1 Tax=Faecalitalea cylindroides TaxID=39483 RepID=A0A1Y4LYB1_9FIRM|nr:HAD family hydrolase [Faecalitalea cylindroides]MEE1448789.1 HAD family hydrolase [Faecalitalea cylindroides]OUP61586.1 hypothetical protein B5F14_01140 [Faecalitalea cylindroides]CDD50201.1 predicted phosphatases [Firmicutes bacterium CAG:308]
MKNDFCLIFDMDGTLWDATGSILNSANEVLEKEKGWKDYLDLDTLNRVMGLEIEEIANIYFPELEQEEKMDLIYKVMDNENLYLSKHGGILYPNVESTLQILSQKYDLMIVTNAQEGYTDAMYQSHGLKKYFIDELTYGETMKPKGQNISLIMERNNYQKAYYIGDTQKDKDACEFAKIPFVYASYGFGDVKDYDKKIDSFEELLNLF